VISKNMKACEIERLAVALNVDGNTIMGISEGVGNDKGKN